MNADGGQGVELTLAQREKIHDAWDLPKEDSLAAFAKEYPEYKDTVPIAGGFHWKWYYAFQHMGDVSVRDASAAYRDGLMQRDIWTRRAGWILPAVGVQTRIHRLAETDLKASLAYQKRIREYHAKLREFLYPYIFNDVPFRQEEFAKLPRWDDK
ncbi:MAG: DUF3526 domain-containing protein [Sphingomonadales bacterium]|nr:DUF3526 domain-containing protein [Sphingomonadales bacterium]